VVLRIDEDSLGISKQTLQDALQANGVPVWYANFERINSLSLFARGTWRRWIRIGDLDRAASNYSASFPTSDRIYGHCGLGLGKMNFLSKGNLKHLQRAIDTALRRSRGR
jgi:hypothetical protein